MQIERDELVIAAAAPMKSGSLLQARKEYSIVYITEIGVLSF